MAYSTSKHSEASTTSAFKKFIFKNANNPTGLNTGRVYLIKATKTFTPSSYNTAGDVIDIFTFPQKTYLIGANVTCDLDLESGGPTLENDLAISSAGVVSSTLVESSTNLRSASGILQYGVTTTSGEFAIPGLDVSGKQLALVTDAAATGANSNTATLTAYALVYTGDLVDLGSSAD